MKIIKKIALVILLVPLCLVFLLNIIEIIRFRVFSFEEPLIVLDQTFCSKDYVGCFGDDKEYTQEYISVGFTVRFEYHLNSDFDSKNYENLPIYQEQLDYSLVKTTFLLFYIIPISF